MIRVQIEDFDPGVELESVRASCKGQAGAIVSFIGVVRDLNQGDEVSQLTLEHYSGMTEKALEKIAEKAVEEWKLHNATIIHRVGALSPDDRIVFVAAASVHRKDAFLACEYMIDTLKTEAPFWKQESTLSGKRWVKP